MGEKINSIPIVEQYHNDYVEYAFYVEKHRTTPEFRDGLKPVQRRIIYTAYKYNHAVELIKTANIEGTTMGKLHPHGNSSIVGAIYSLCNWYQTKLPLLNGRGNLGNLFENSPAASRYTECKLSKFTMECILDELIQNPDVIDWEDNYDRTSKEPVYLPAKVPLLLINGCSAIGVGNKVDIPTHNICEVIDATIALIKNPNMKKLTLIPDHCQACEIIDTNWEDICRKGSGKYKVRGKIDIEEYSGHNNKYKGYPILVIKSCPNLTFLDSIIDSIESLIKTNKLIGILDSEEQSTVDEPMRYVLVLKPGTDPNFIKSQLYKHTRLQQTFRVDFRILDGMDRENKVMRFSYIGYLKAWINFRKLTKIRYYENKLQKIMTKSHMLENYIWAIQSGISDDIIDIIKKQTKVDDNATIEALIKKCKITDLQAKFFINCEIKKLSKGYLNQFIKENNELQAEAQMCRDAVLIDGRLEEIIINELLEIKSKYAMPRMCRVIKESEANGIAEGIFKIVITESNFIRKLTVNDNVSVKNNDAVKYVFDIDNSDDILLFDNIGRVYKIPVSKIPFTDKNTNGIDIRIINKYINANIIRIYFGSIIKSFYENNTNQSVLVSLTKNGYIKKIELGDLVAVPSSGILYTKLDEGDYVVDMMLFDNSYNDIVVYNESKALKININEIPLLKRNSKGNMSMDTSNVEGMCCINNNTSDIIVITSKGYFNRIIPDCLKSGRAKKGSNVIKLTKGDSIKKIIGVNDNNTIRCIGINKDILDIPVTNIPKGSSISTGQRFIPARFELSTIDLL